MTLQPWLGGRGQAVIFCKSPYSLLRGHVLSDILLSKRNKSERGEDSEASKRGEDSEASKRAYKQQTGNKCALGDGLRSLATPALVMRFYDRDFEADALLC